MNSVQILNCHRLDRGPWAFDDARFLLVDEPFVFGANDAIERALARKYPGQVCNNIRFTFSTTPLPHHDIELHRKWPGGDMAAKGCVYYDKSTDDPQEDVWLCPAMRHYFSDGDGHENGPERIYAVVELID